MCIYIFLSQFIIFLYSPLFNFIVVIITVRLFFFASSPYYYYYHYSSSSSSFQFYPSLILARQGITLFFSSYSHISAITVACYVTTYLSYIDSIKRLYYDYRHHVEPVLWPAQVWRYDFTSWRALLPCTTYYTKNRIEPKRAILYGSINIYINK